MPRAVRALLLGIGLAGGAAMATGGHAGATVPPTPPPAATTGGGAVVVTVVAAPPTTAVVPIPPAGSRGGAAAGSVAKPVNDPWSPRRIATMTAFAVVALAAVGYAYGKLRSAPPRHPDLTRRPPDLEDADRIDAPG